MSICPSAETRSIVPLEPVSFAHLLASRPDLATSILAHLSPRNIQAQAQAHSALLAAQDVFRSPQSVLTDWQHLINTYCPTSAPTMTEATCDYVIDPEVLSLAEISEARLLIAALTPTQRIQQAIAQASWLASSSNHSVTAESLLASWASDAAR